MREFAEELQQHYEQETNNPNEKSFYQRLLIKYGQKLDEIQKRKNTKGAGRTTYPSRKKKKEEEEQKDKVRIIV